QGSEDKQTRLVSAIRPRYPLDWRYEGRASGREHQHVVAHARTGAVHHPLHPPIDPRHARAGVQGHPILGVPLGRVEKDVRRILTPGENVREENPVVVPVRLVAEHRYVIEIPAAPPDHILDQPGSGHTIPHYYEALPGGH